MYCVVYIIASHITGEKCINLNHSPSHTELDTKVKGDMKKIRGKERYARTYLCIIEKRERDALDAL
jgi:hypothetical protein